MWLTFVTVTPISTNIDIECSNDLVTIGVQNRTVDDRIGIADHYGIAGQGGIAGWCHIAAQTRTTVQDGIVGLIGTSDRTETAALIHMIGRDNTAGRNRIV